jgi:hypothetical protein
MTILSNCDYAIFDVSTEAGQYAEIEHARLKGIKSILVYSAAEERDKDHHRSCNDSNSRISD